MAIPIEHEDTEELKKWGTGLEVVQGRCTFCGQHTRYWHTCTNNQVCPDCAKTHTVADLKAKP
jgi:hypothetical protein